MNRQDFLKGVGILGAGALLPFSNARADNGTATKNTASCVLIPSETEGPFPLDLTTNNSATYFRQDIREGKAGVTTYVRMKVLGLSNCLPMPNVRVNIWHCDKDGIYSGYYNNMNTGSTPATASATWLRGYQMTDADGEVNFTTIFPGWYTSRIMHIHFQIYVSSIYKAVSQMTIDPATKNALYSANASVYTKGTDPQALSSDNIFSDGYNQQLGTLTQNADGTYTWYFEVSINGSGTSTGVREYEGENGGQFKLGQNFPNPHTGTTTIPFTLINGGDVTMDIYDLSARKVASIPMGSLGTGDHRLPIDFASLGIAPGSYLYQIQVANSNGVFRQVKMMTAAK